MPLPYISVPAYPDVPALPGVPTLARAAGQVVTAAADLLTGDVLGAISALLGPQWGIFDQYGSPVLVGDSVVGVALRREFAVADYPVEAGAFASYNKVALPFDARVVFTKGGSEYERAAFLAQLEAMVQSLELFSVVVPEFVYPNANIVHYDFERRARNGATLLTVAVGVREIRVTAPASFTQSNTQSPSGASAQNGGAVQPATPTADQANAAATEAPSYGGLY